MSGRCSSALVVLSGGQDSTTCLYWAKTMFHAVRALTFDYGQRHRTEIYAAREIAEGANVPWSLISVPDVGKSIFSALTRPDVEIKVEEAGSQARSLPNTFVPGRNIIFLSIAAGVAVSLGIRDLVTGVCETDYSGYPDCREPTIRSMEHTLGLALDSVDFSIHTPLMHLSKAKTVELALQVGAWGALAKTVTCYQGFIPGCGECPACVLRAKGFREAGQADPARRAT